jgi:GT2 family glycosyltransferase
MVNATSICVPAFHAAGFLPEALSSVRAQTFTEWELIVVEDGSDDGSRGVVEAFAASVTQRVRYIRHNQNRGLPAARNSAMHAAKGRFIALLDSDDLWTADHLESCLRAQQSSGADLVSAASELFDDQTGVVEEIRTPTEEEIRTMPMALYRRNFMQPSAVVFRSDVLEHVGGFDEGLRSCEDLDYWFQLLRAGCRFAYTGLPTCRYRKHGATMTANAYRMSASLAQVREKHFDWAEIPRRMRVRETANAFGSAARIIRSTDPSTSRSLFLRALRYEPWRPIWWVCLAACLLVQSRRSAF